jgi:LacI family transcriptional regulator
VVETQMRTDPPPFFCVAPDERLAGEEAAKHFLQLGFRHFAACISSEKSYQQKRWDGFRHVLREAGHDASLLDISTLAPPKGLLDRTDQLTKWLGRQPRPLAMMFGWVPKDSRLTEACERARLRIPEDIAVIGVGANQISAELNWPTLTTVQFNLADVGFQSAALLHRLMRGEKGVPPITLIPPTGIRARMSTDIASVEDETVAAALRLIRENAPHPLPVDALARRVGVGRRTLEMRFQSALQCTPGHAMRRQRVEFAKSQLRSPQDKLLSVAMACGYHSYGDFVKAFRDIEGMSPAEYRAKLSGEPRS